MRKYNESALEEPLKANDKIYINHHVCISKVENFHSIFFSGIPVFCYYEGDKVAQDLAMLLLVDEGLAQTNEVAQAFGIHRSTIFRNQKKVASEGISGLIEKKRGPQGGKKIKEEREKLLKKLKSQGLTNVAIAHKLGVSEGGVRKALRRIGYKPKEDMSKQVALLEADAGCVVGFEEKEKSNVMECSGSQEQIDPGTREAATKECEREEACKSIEVSADVDPTERTVDRLLARMGVLDDAVPMFSQKAKAVCAGFLLALPFLVSSGVFDIMRKVYGSIGPAFYGLRATLLTLLMMAILRIKRPEGLKEKSPACLGLLLGLDRAPEVKTLRSKLTRLSGYGKAYEFLKILVSRRIKQQRKAVGYLYIDGFVRVYYGERTLSKAYVAQRRLAMAGVTDYWVNDQNGEPLFVVTSQANAALTKMMIPLLREIRDVVGKKRLTVVFDRGGWSPKLFQEILAMKFDIITYRKGKIRKLPKRMFTEHTIRVNGDTMMYQLCDRTVKLLDGKLQLRQVTRLREGNHQTQVLTSRWDLTAAMVVYRMFNRWRQENYFKYMREEYALDVLVDYKFEVVDTTTEVVNPKRKEVAKKLKALRTELAKCEQRYGAEVLKNDGTKHAALRRFKITNGELCQRIETLRKQVEKLKKKQRSLDQRISAHEAFQGKLVRLSYERKLLTDVVKMLAYRAESALVNLIKPYYSRADEEGRTLIASFFQNTAMIELQQDKLMITFDPLSSPHRTKTLENLCSDLNKTEVKFPGTDYVLEYRVNN